MMLRSGTFLSNWLAEHVTGIPSRYASIFKADELARACVAAAEGEGISLRELELGLGTDLASHISIVIGATRGPRAHH